MDFITIRSCTILFLLYIVVCVIVAFKCKANDPFASGVGFAILSPIIASMVYLLGWFTFNAVLGNFG